MRILSSIFFLFVIISNIGAVPDTLHERWDWSSIDAGDWDRAMQEFFAKEKFTFGVSTAEYQISGAQKLPHSQFAQWEEQTWLSRQGIPGMQRSGDACCGWDHYQKDIDLLQELGVSSYRFSVDWSAVEPVEGKFNEEALQHYVDLCRALRAANIEPMITLHHFVHPQWFENRGAFEQEENIECFVNFCVKVFERLSPYVSLWCTINEPGVYILQGYLRGVYPSGKSVPVLIPKESPWVYIDRSSRHNIGLAGRVLQHLLRAHVEVYWKFHELYEKSGAWQDSCREPQVGFAHQYLKFEPFHGGVLGLCESRIAAVFNIWQNFAILEFFKTGHFPYFTYYGSRGIAYSDQRAPNSFDYFGLNYYSNVFLNCKTFAQDYYDEDIQTDMPYSVYAEGFYQAIMDVAQFDKPIYITENGVADALDREREHGCTKQKYNLRKLWSQRYIFALYWAMRSGCDVRGYYCWSLMDNFEWDMGYPKKFGLYEVENIDKVGQPKNRTLRMGAQWFQQMALAVRSAAQS